MEGSAAVIGEMMLPVLEPRDPRGVQAPARALGLAFQLTNFLRDVDEDLDRGRVYLPQEDLRRFGVDLRRRHSTPEWRALMAYEIERNRALYAFADTGIAMLPPALGALRRGGAGAVRADPGPDREGRLQRVQRPGPGAHGAQGADRGADHGDRTADPQRRLTGSTRRDLLDHAERTPCRCVSGTTCRTAGLMGGCPSTSGRGSRSTGPAAAGEPDDRVLAAGQAGPDRRLAWRCPRRRTPAAGSWPGRAPTSGRPSRWPGPSPAARWCSGATPTGPWSPAPAPARTSAR